MPRTNGHFYKQSILRGKTHHMIWCLMNDDEDVRNDVHAYSLHPGMKGRAE